MHDKKFFTVQKLVIIGLMSALVFAATNFRIIIPTALGKTMLHFGNVMCILAGLLFGGPIGGLAAGFGSMFFDLLDPEYAPEALITFFNKFAMGFTAGIIAHRRSASGNKFSYKVIGAVSGGVVYVILYTLKNFVVNYLVLGNHINVVLSVVAVKAGVSLVNNLIAVVVSLILAATITPALKSAGIYKRLS